MKTTMLFFLGFLMGAGTGYLVTNSLLKKKYADLADAEIESVKEAFERAKEKSAIITPISKKKKKELVSESEACAEIGKKLVEGLQKGITKAETDFINPSKTLTRSSLENNPYEVAKRNYHLIGTEPQVEPEEPKDNEEEDEEDDGVTRDDAGFSEQDMMDLTRVDRTQPYIIGDREYSEEFDHHTKCSLYYYRTDDVLCEESEDVIDDIEGTVGYDAIATLDTQTTVWVRNEPLTIDYEIIAMNNSFAEAVHGIHLKEHMTPRERYEHNKKRREKDGE